MAEQQLLNEPDNRAYAGVHRFYESFLLNKPKEFQDWLIVRSGDRNTLYLGESFRHQGEYQKEDSLFQRLLKSELYDIRIPLNIAFAKALQYVRE